MSTVLVSVNAQQAVTDNSVVHRLAGVVYYGPSIHRAVVVWSAEFREVLVASITAVRLGLRKGSTDGRLLLQYFTVVQPDPLQKGRAGGVVVMDLEPGDVLELVGASDDPGAVALAENGLTVIVT